MSTDAATTSVYDSIDANLVPVINGIVDRVKMRMKKTVENIVEIGTELNSAKNLLKHGQFGEWLKAEFHWSVSTAERYMRVADRFPDIRQIEGFAPSVLYALSSPSATTEAVDEALAAGPDITVAETSEIVDRHKDGGGSSDSQFVEADFGDESAASDETIEEESGATEETTFSDPTPPSNLAPIWREIERHLETAAEMFERNAQECDQALAFKMGIRSSLIEFKNYVEAVEKV